MDKDITTLFLDNGLIEVIEKNKSPQQYTSHQLAAYISLNVQHTNLGSILHIQGNGEDEISIGYGFVGESPEYKAVIATNPPQRMLINKDEICDYFRNKTEELSPKVFARWLEQQLSEKSVTIRDLRLFSINVPTTV